MKHAIQLGAVQETLLMPLYARALERRRKRPILDDPKAVEIVASLDWDFQRFGQRRRVLTCVLRSAMFDEWVKDFLLRHPAGTVVDIGAGLNTRFERCDNGRVRWFDLDLADTVALRRKFFTDAPRRTTLTGSVLDPAWIPAVRKYPGPYFFAAEAVFVYLQPQEVKEALARIAAEFPGASIAFDTVNRRCLDTANRDYSGKGVQARLTWACEYPKQIESWGAGLRLVESRTLADFPDSLKSRIPWPTRTAFRIFRKLAPKLAEMYRLNLFTTPLTTAP